MSTDFNCDVLIIGSGAAGLSLALSLSQHTDVIVLSKATIETQHTTLKAAYQPLWTSRIV